MKYIIIVMKEIVPGMMLLIKVTGRIIHQWTIIRINIILMIHIGRIYWHPAPIHTIAMVKSLLIIVGMCKVRFQQNPHNVHLNVLDYCQISKLLLSDKYILILVSFTQ